VLKNFALFDDGEMADLQLLLVQNEASSCGLTEKDRKTPLLPATVVYDIQMDLARYFISRAQFPSFPRPHKQAAP
jgi:hypothetical protein